nr:MAG TPA: hypothetical protein [Caudoviricetes sp.]
MEKKAYKLLKKLYRKSILSHEEINRLTGFAEDTDPNPYTTYLRVGRYIETVRGNAYIGNNGTLETKTLWRITLQGRDFIESKRRELLLFWLPYSITTALAIAALLR